MAKHGIPTLGLLPADKFETHPEWFRMTEEGERTPNFNLCASNEEALDYFAEQAAALAKKLYRSSDRYFLWVDDVKNSSCHCQQCQKLTPSDQQQIILNRMVQRMRKDNPKATLAYLAYVERIEPPTSVKPAKGIFLEYALSNGIPTPRWTAPTKAVPLKHFCLSLTQNPQRCWTIGTTIPSSPSGRSRRSPSLWTSPF